MEKEVYFIVAGYEGEGKRLKSVGCSKSVISADLGKQSFSEVCPSADTCNNRMYMWEIERMYPIYMEDIKN